MASSLLRSMPEQGSLWEQRNLPHNRSFALLFLRGSSKRSARESPLRAGMRLLLFLLLAAATALCSLSPAGAASPSPSSREAELLAAARALTPWLSDLRKSLHETPELGFDLPVTHKKISAVLKKLGVEHRRARGKAKDGIVATIGDATKSRSTSDGDKTSSNHHHLVYALRADMDALPILEESAYPSHSKNKGVMHACGHDAHMTMLLGAAKLLKEREARLVTSSSTNSSSSPPLRASVRLLFQPAEEGGAGGKVMADEGELDGVNAGLSGLHVWPALSSGKITSRPGTLMAAAGRWEAEIKGAGGHGAMPHLSKDPVVAGSAVVMALQTLVSREVRPTAGGETFNFLFFFFFGAVRGQKCRRNSKQKDKDSLFVFLLSLSPPLLIDSFSIHSWKSRRRNRREVQLGRGGLQRDPGLGQARGHRPRPDLGGFRDSPQAGRRSRLERRQDAPLRGRGRVGSATLRPDEQRRRGRAGAVSSRG